MSSRHKHPGGDLNGGLSPAKVPKVDEDEELSKEERIARMRDFFNSKAAKGVPPTRPKPKPKPLHKTPSVVVTEEKMEDGSSEDTMSPDQPVPPAKIELNLESLRKFSDIADFDFNAVVRSQMLDNTPQKDRAALSQSKGLQNRRLPKDLAAKLPDDYQARRRAQTYTPVKRSSSEASRGTRRSIEEPDFGARLRDSEMTEEERKRKILAKAGIQQSNPLAALGNILRRSGRSPKPSKKLESPVLKPKPVKQKPAKDSPDLTRRVSDPSSSPPRSPKSGFRFLRRSSSRNSDRKRSKLMVEGFNSDSLDDLRSETSSISSLNVHTTLKEEEKPMDTQPSIAVVENKMTPEKSPEKSPPKENGEMDTSSILRDKSQLTPSPRLNISVGGVSKRRTDSHLFKEPADVEPLFGDDSALFDSGEMDKFMGKKEATPERVLLARRKQKEEEEQKEKEAEKEREQEKKRQREREQERERILLRSSPRQVDSPSPKPKADIRSRLQMYESGYKAKSEKEEKPILTSTPKPDAEPTTTKKKGAGLFEGVEEEEDELFKVSSEDETKKRREQEKEDEKSKKSEFDKKKARLFDHGELFQGGQRSPVERKPPPKRELFGSPKHEPVEASTRGHVKSPVEKKEEAKPLFGSPTHKSSPRKRPVDEADKEEEKPAKPSVQATIDEPLSRGAKTKMETIGVMDYEESPFGAKTIEERRRRKRETQAKMVEKEEGEKEKNRSSLFSDDKEKKKAAHDEVDSLFGVRPPSKERERTKEKSPSPIAMETVENVDELDKIADSLFGETQSKKQEETKKEQKESESLLEEIKRSPKTGRRAWRRSPEPAKAEVAEPLADPLGAIAMKTEVERESEKRQKEKDADREEKRKKSSDLFGEEPMETTAPTELEQKGSSVSDRESAISSPEVKVVEEDSTPPDADKTPEAKVEEKVDAKAGDDKKEPPEIKEPEPEEKLPEKKEEPTKRTETRTRAGGYRSRLEAREARDTKSSSPRSPRSPRSSAETVKSASERKAKTPSREDKKETDAGKPSWMLDLQKRRKSQEKPPPKQALETSTKKGEEDIPEWRKRILERKRQQAEASPKLDTPSSATSRLNRSPRADKKGTKSPSTERKSPKAGDDSKKSPQLRGRGRDLDKSTEVGRGRTPDRIKAEKSDTTTRTSSSRISKSPSVDKTTKTEIRLTSRRNEKKKEAEKKDSSPEISRPSTSPDVSSKEPSPKESTPVEKKTPPPSELKLSDKEEEVEKAKEEDEAAKEREPSKVAAKLSTGDKEAVEEENPLPATGKKSLAVDLEDDVFVSSGEKSSSVSAGEKDEETKTKEEKPAEASGSELRSRHSSASPEQNEVAPYRSRSLSRSPTPTPPPSQPAPGPLKATIADASIPEWKRRILERKSPSAAATTRVGGTGSTTAKKTESRASRGRANKEPEEPAWKKELMAKRKDRSTETKPRDTRSSTVSTVASRRGAGTKAKREEPDFMKEFKQRKQRLSNKD